MIDQIRSAPDQGRGPSFWQLGLVGRPYIATLAAMGTQHDTPMTVVDAVIEANASRRTAMAERIVNACGGSVAGKTLAVLGLTFKPNTDEMREAPSLAILPVLRAKGATVRAYDPAGMDEAHKHLPGVTMTADPYACMESADTLIILTWDQFRALDFSRVKAAYDGRVDGPTLAVLTKLKESGRKLVLVTGRELGDLKRVF